MTLCDFYFRFYLELWKVSLGEWLTTASTKPKPTSVMLTMTRTKHYTADLNLKDEIQPAPHPAVVN